MKKPIICFVLLLLVFLLSSCQSLDDFVVINRSTVPVEVVYTFKGASSRNVDITEPRIIDTTKLTKTNRQWETLAQGQYTIDRQLGKVSITLVPGKALLVQTTSNYRETDEFSRDRFRISSISLVGNNGSVKFEGEQARRAFHYDDFLHVLNYW